MPRTSRVWVGALLAAGALAACSSSGDGSNGADGTKSPPRASGSRSAAPNGTRTPAPVSSSPDTPPAGTHGHLDYSGSVSGGFDITQSVTCATTDGKLTTVVTPAPWDNEASPTPSFTANLVGDQNSATLLTKDGSFLKLGADGLSAVKRGGVWTVTVSGMELTAPVSGRSVTVRGTLQCTKVGGT